MRGVSLGKVLYREPRNVENLVFIAVSVGVMLPFGLFFVVLDLITGGALVAMSLVFLIYAHLFVPRRSGVYEGGVILSVSLWTEWVRRTRRLVLSRDIHSASPALYGRTGEKKHRLRGYDFSFPGGDGRVLRGRGSPDLGTRLEEAVRTMLGPRWDEAYRPCPELNGSLVSRIERVVSRPLYVIRGWTWAGILLFVGVQMAAGFLMAGTDWTLGSIVWIWVILASTGVGACVGLVLLMAGGRAARADIAALNTFLQIREHEGNRSVRVLPRLALHPDFTGPAFFGDVKDMDFDRLRRDLGLWRLAAAWQVLAVALAVGTLQTVFSLGLPYWIALIAALVALCMIAPGVNVLLGHHGARDRLVSVIQEEWKRGVRLVPATCPLPRRYERLRDPLAAAHALRTRLRVARAFNAVPGLTGVLILAGFFVGILPLWAGLQGPGVYALPFLTIATAIAFWAWTEDGRILLEHLLTYEEVTGKAVIPARLHG